MLPRPDDLQPSDGEDAVQNEGEKRLEGLF